MSKDIKISASASIGTEIVIKKARAAVALATDNKYRFIPFCLHVQYTKSITV